MEVQFQISPEEAKDEVFIHNRIAQEIGVSEKTSFAYTWLKRSIDARKKEIKINASFQVFLDGVVPTFNLEFEPRKVDEHSGVVHIVGAGPAGLFAALRALELGLKPIVYERGKDVRSRRRDLALINRNGTVNPESNYCFGEGGAGTYSDGKLYTRSKKRGDVMKALKWFVHFGAHHDIIVDAHPHIGTNKLPQIIVAMRELIKAYGGEVHFETKLTNIEVENHKLVSIELNNNSKVKCNSLVVATGHSARDIFDILHQAKVKLEAKPFALGVRIEHTQELIDKIQYHGRLNDDFLPPASYSLVTQVEEKGVFSFCMCPGGIIAPCATENGEVVTNGWSPSKRNNPTSNSGIVVSVEPSELPGYSVNDPFVSLNFQRQIEQTCWQAAGCTQAVPAQRLLDFIQGKKSTNLPSSSYQPGIASVDLNTILPPFISKRLRVAFVDFGKKMNGFLTNEALLHAPESRTSSPISVPRDKETCMSVNTIGVFPCGEGAGYAGGIISAAIDGMKCVDAVFTFQKEKK